MKYNLVRVCAAVPETTVANTAKNTQIIIDMIKAASEKKVNVICFPELCITSYTLGDLFRQSYIIKQAMDCLNLIKEKTKKLDIISIVGLPLQYRDKLYNVAAVVKSGVILGIVPKAFIPNYGEYYEQRWFKSGEDIKDLDIDICGQSVPFGVDLLFECNGYDKFTFGIEVCEDLWSPFPPNGYQALAGSYLCFNLSASNEIVGKADFRKDMVRHQSARYICGYTYVSAGCGESTTDTVFGGQALLCENGNALGETPRFSFENQCAITEFDLERLSHDRILRNTFEYPEPKREYRRIKFDLKEDNVLPKYRKLSKMPFVPYGKADRAHRCQEVFDIQTTGIMKRMKHAYINKLVIGVSGGLDSTLALLVAKEAVKRLGLAPTAVLGVVMPGFGSTKETQSLARSLVKSMGAELKEISIVRATNGHLEDLEHPPENRDITYENAQARERTQILMDLSNQQGGMVVGTGDLSELALGFCTYAGDQISMYGVNAGIAKTLIKEIVMWRANLEGGDVLSIIEQIISIPPSPELLPGDEVDVRQDTQKQIGAYNLNDFFMYYILRFQMSPQKILTLAHFTYGDEYTKDEIKTHLKNFYTRFFRSQFKRSCMPDGPKVGSVSLSPRADWRMPSDADCKVWLDSLEEA
jgi:NAD+ synthase (glutamine-hydrolysing)